MAAKSERVELGRLFFAAPTDLDFEGATFKARSDHEKLGLLRWSALRRLTFDMSGSHRQAGVGPE